MICAHSCQLSSKQSCSGFVEKKFDFDELFSAVNSLPDSTQLDLFGLQAAKNTLQSLLKIAQVLKTHFDVVATNPPFI